MLFVLFAMLLMPIGAWAEDYPIKIGDTTLSSENIGKYAGVSYDADTRTMTLNGAALHAPIVWSGDDDFVIEINTTSVSSISIDDYTPVIQGDGTSSLTIKRAEYSSQTAYLVLSAYYNATEANFDKESCSPIIQGFTSVSTPGLQKVLNSRGIDEGKEFTLYLNEKPSVAVAGNEPDDGIFTVGVTPEGSVTFDATTNILYMNNATISISGDNNGICNSLETLTIKLKGNNKIISEMSDAIVSDNEIGSLVIERDNTDVGPAQLIISAADEVIEGFSSLTYNEFTPYSVENDAPVSSINITYDQVSGISDGTNELHSIAFVASGTSIVVAGHAPGTDGTITGAGISGTVTFTPASGDNPATLTLNKATIDMSEIPGLCPIESSIANLTIQLIGYNKLTPNSDNFNGIKFTEGTTTGNLTFTTSNVVEEYGSLSVDGIYQFSDLTSGYNVTNSFTTGEQTGWSKTESGGYGQTYNSVRIDYTEYYDVWVGGARLSSSSLSPVSGGTKYIPSTHTLHLAGYGYDNEIKSGLPEFIVEVSGSNNSVSNITFEGNTPGTIIFKKDESSVSGNKVDFTGSVKGFSSVTITPPLQLVSPSGYNNPTSAQWNSFTNVSIADYVTYNIIVAGVQVTDANKGNVLNDAGTPTVVFTPADNTVSPATPATLTLNGASINGKVRSYLSNLTIELIGNNTVAVNDTSAIATWYDAASLNFTTSATSPGSLTLTPGSSFHAIGDTGKNFQITYENGLSLNPATPDAGETAVVGVSYGLTVAGVTVSNVNASNVLGGATATVVFTPADNTASPATPATLTLNGATIAGSIVSGLENLTVVINGENTTGKIEGNTTTNTDKNITFKGGTDGSTLTMTSTLNSALEGFASVSYDGAYPVSSIPSKYYTGYQEYMALHGSSLDYPLSTLTISTTPHYPLWIGATQINENNKDDVFAGTALAGKVSYNSTSKILSLTNAELSSHYIMSDLDALTISVEGDCVIAAADSSAAVRSMNGAATLTIAKKNSSSTDISTLKLGTDFSTASISWFNSVVYSDFILLDEGATYEDQLLRNSDRESLTQATFTSGLKKPTLRMYYPDVDNFSGNPYYKFVNPNGGGTVKYSRFFASESINDDINQKYNDGTFDVMIDSKWAPVVCKVWVEANGSVSDTLYACRLDVENMEATYGDTNVPVPTLLPQAVDGVTTTYALRDTDVETHAANITSDGTISLLSPGQEWLKATFTVGDGVEYIKNASNEVPSAEFYIVVKPSKPTLSHETGSYAGTQTVTFTDEFVDNQNITAWYYTYEGEEPANPTVNPVPDGGIPVSSSENVAVYYRLRYDENDNVDLFAYSDTTNVAITILEDIDNCMVTGNGNVTYTGVAQTPTLTVTPAVGGEALVLGTDYTVSYKKGETAVESMIDAGDYTIVITAKEGSAYGGTKEVDFTIDQANLGDVTIAEIVDQTYTGSQITPTDITVTFNGNAVSEDEYTISYGTNINVGEGTVTLTSKNKNFSTTSTKGATFTIVAKTLTADMVISVASVTYTGSAVEPELTIRDGDLDLEKGTDYTVIYSDNVSAGTNTAKATITGKGNYTGSADKMFTINKAQLTVTPDDKTYNVGDNIELTVSYDGFVDGDDEDVLTTEPTASYGTADITKPGSYEITASGGVAQNYDFVYETGTLTINRQLTVSFSTSNEWATYYGTENLATPEGLKAYQVTAVDGSTVTIGEIGYIPANTAVLLKNVSNNNTWSNIAASAYTGATSTFASNKLIGTAEAVNVSDISGGTVYVLYKDMFKRATGGTIPANRGYLVVAPSSGNAPELSITIGDDTTGIGMVGCDSVATDNDEWYTLDGQKLQQAPTQKGLYIKNGKKVVINKK